MRSRLAKFAVAAATAAATTAIFAGTALADAPPSYTPVITDLAGMGSDTAEIVMNKLTWGEDVPATNPAVTGYNSTVAQSAGWYNSYNATGSATVDTKPGCVGITRQNGSSAGINALKAAPTLSTVDNTTPCLDFARSSRGPNANGSDVDNLGNPLFFLPYALDGLQYASATTTNAPQTLQVAALKAIYTTVGITWNNAAVGGTSTDVIQKVIPQAGSGTRSFFEAQLGIADNQLASDVIVAQEHDPVPIAANADRIGPFSSARFTHTNPAGIQLDGPVPTCTFHPTTCSGPTGFFATRNIYNVVRLDPNTFLVPAKFNAMFGDGSGTGTPFVCSSAGAALIQGEGFIPLPNGTAAGDCDVAVHTP
jgi:ABC-type phosphate transport system substrate-binding protein